jgi:hypothetical protein
VAAANVRGGDSRDETFAATGRRFEWTSAKTSVKARRVGDDTSARAVGVDLVARHVVTVACVVARTRRRTVSRPREKTTERNGDASVVPDDERFLCGSIGGVERR